MRTEQEVMAALREKIAKSQLKPETQKLLNKLATVEKILSENQKNLKELQEKTKELDSEALRLRGAVSILIELMAESEEMI